MRMKVLALMLPLFGFSSVLSAATVITEQNISRLEAALPQLAKIEQDSPAELKRLRLQPHCNWPQHVSELQAKESGKEYVAQMQQILAAHQLTPAVFLELTAKGAWPVLQSMQPMLNLSQQSLPFLPQAQRDQVEKTLAQTSHMQKVIQPCLTSEDLAALQQHQQRFINLAVSMPGLAI
ncbi:hypothetical protein LMJ53_00565 [Rheinheimera sp. UJ51]|uniref:hypothetical protein n=1 Tax=unclassified Rheinheimera TaxID=115860 RepID=UPI001E642283|nr:MULTISPECIES: hypothetical protein [unclassified Rheinheimera]MCC5450226.1 hypothetical protein [Rheinheimera sp. UJ51]MCF4009323.1 hypothetical protein [Rheinheimera sp. UJ63]